MVLQDVSILHEGKDRGYVQRSHLTMSRVEGLERRCTVVLTAVSAWRILNHALGVLARYLTCNSSTMAEFVEESS